MQILCSPNTNDIDQYLKRTYKKQVKSLHVVPTMILFRKRAATYREILKNKKEQLPRFGDLTDQKISEILSKHSIYLFEINRLLNFLAYQLPLPILSKKESLIILQRVLENNKNTNNTAWSSATKELLKLFYQLSITELSIQTLLSISNNNTWQTIIHLYNSYLQKLKKYNYLDLGLAINKAIQSNILERFDHIYFDGTFLPIQPPLHKLIMKLKSLRKNITFFLPIDLTRKNNPCFRVVIDTYKNYVPVNQWINIHNPNKTKSINVIQKVTNNIFSDQTIQIDDRSIEFFQFPTLDDELNYVIQSIAKKIKQGVNPKKIAIVTTNPMEIKPMVCELAQLYKLHYPIQEKPLIDLPFGKLISGLLRIHTDERIPKFNQENHYIDSPLFSELLYTKLFKQSHQIIPIFRKLKAFFEDCYSFENWYTKIEQLKTAKRSINNGFRYHPLFNITIQQLDSLQAFLEHIEQLSRKLMQHANRTLSDHLQVFIQHLTSDPQLTKIDDETINRLKDILTDTLHEKSLLVSTKEFSRQIQSILTDDPQDNDSVTQDLAAITVTGPNNIEFVPYEYIYVVRFTQQYFPEPIQYNWPSNEEILYKILKNTTAINGADKNFLRKYFLNRSLFHLFTVLNSSQKKLIINFAKSYDGQPQTPSHYLNDIAKVFRIEEDSSQPEKKIEKLLKQYGLLTQPQIKYKTDPFPTKNLNTTQPINNKNSISLEELTIYDYCPQRFFYQKQHPTQIIYTNSFQLKKYAQACLYEKAIPSLVEKYPNINKRIRKKIIHTIDQILNVVEKEIKKIFPLGERHWEDIRFGTKQSIISLIEKIFSKIKNREGRLKIVEDKKKLRIENYIFTGQRELQVTSNIGKKKETYYYVISNFKEFLSFSTKQETDISEEIKNDYFQKVKFFFNLFDKKAKELSDQKAKELFADYAKKITQSSFNKKAGEHCYYCPYIDNCLERAIQ